MFFLCVVLVALRAQVENDLAQATSTPEKEQLILELERIHEYATRANGIEADLERLHVNSEDMGQLRAGKYDQYPFTPCLS